MNLAKWLALLLVGLLIASVCTADESKEYHYMPLCGPDICVEKHVKQPNRNWVFLMTGTGLVPYQLDHGQPFNPKATTFQVQYFRMIKDDLLVGGGILGNEHSVSGWQVGIGAGF